MKTQQTGELHFRTGRKSGIWFALLVALGLHLTILFLPAKRSTRISEFQQTRLELQLVKSTLPEKQQADPAQAANIVPAPIESEPGQLLQLPPRSIAALKSEPEPESAPPKPVTGLEPRAQTIDLESLSRAEKDRLTHSILARQFITPESISDNIFGRQDILQTDDPQREFHYPIRQDMIAMLDQPMPDMPFAYTPGLVRFAYDPGVKGDLQRFWDDITPEFGWITKNGTEFRCIWALVIVGCGWK